TGGAPARRLCGNEGPAAARGRRTPLCPRPGPGRSALRGAAGRIRRGPRRAARRAATLATGDLCAVVPDQAASPVAAVLPDGGQPAGVEPAGGAAGSCRRFAAADERQ